MIQVTADVAPEELEALVDADIVAFDRYFQSMGNDPLLKAEKAIIKTYMFFQLRVKGKIDGQTTSG